MQAIILAAGLGRRLGALTERSTKCMVELNGRKLIEYTLDAVVECGLERIVIVVGHGADELRAFVGAAYRGVPVFYVENRAYRRTNNIHSLHLAAEFLKADDSVVIESDVVFDKAILRDCLVDSAPNIAVVAQYGSEMDGTVVLVDDQRRIVRFVPRAEFAWSDAGRYFKTVNIYKLSRPFLVQRFLPFLETYVRTEGRNAYYEEVLRLLVFIGNSDLAAMPVTDSLWYEIDDPNDLDIAGTLFAPVEARRARLETRYGGFWRFPKLRDFYYLVNPYFPTPPLLEELAHALPQLIAQYPSGSRVQRLLAGRLVGCDPSMLAVGNGASELITALLASAPLAHGRVGVVIPTFDEYRRALVKQPLLEFSPSGPDFRYASAELADFCQTAQLSTLVLVNPGNPTGYFLERDQLIDLAARLRHSSVRLVVDESFVDFVDGTPRHSLIDEDVLKTFPNLVVIKSISKSYGVPSLRLGVLASSEPGLADDITTRLPIWNINSIAEYFLQIIGKYETPYWAACARVAVERARFTSELQKLSFVHPLPSSTNFILCKLTEEMTASGLADALARDHWTLIKDCSGKPGFSEGAFVRIAIRSTEDNDALLQALQQLERTPSNSLVAVGAGA